MKRLRWIRLAYRARWHLEAAVAPTGRRRTVCGFSWSTSNVRDYEGDASGDGPVFKCPQCVDARVPARRS
jgi:hypothetical protein